MIKIDAFIDALANSDQYIKDIYSLGGCYQFHLILSKLYVGAKPYISKNRAHVITKYKGRYYDIFGERKDVKLYEPMDDSFLLMVESWSFGRNYKLKIAECSFCDEPFLA